MLHTCNPRTLTHSHPLPPPPPPPQTLTQVIFNTVAQNSRPDIPEDADLPGNPGGTLVAYKALMERCWSPSALDRPSFKQVRTEGGRGGGVEGAGGILGVDANGVEVCGACGVPVEISV